MFVIIEVISIFVMPNKIGRNYVHSKKYNFKGGLGLYVH